MLVLCSLLLIVNVGVTMASTTGYSITEYYGGTAVTVDGKWTTADEWHDAPIGYLKVGSNQVCAWEYKMDSSTGAYLMSWLIEFADHTNDAGDQWVICIDGANEGPTAPNANDVMFDIVGHTTLNAYIGNGTGWSKTTATTIWKDSLTTSPNDPSTHWVLEFQVDKGQWGWGANPPPEGFMIGMYDASNAAQGWVSWPPTPPASFDNPSTYGLIETYASAPAPEGLTIGVMLALSSVAVIVSIRYFRKPPKL